MGKDYAYVWWVEWALILSRDKQNWMQRVVCSPEDVADLLAIKAWDMEAIQSKIKEILFENQLKFNYTDDA